MQFPLAGTTHTSNPSDAEHYAYDPADNRTSFVKRDASTTFTYCYDGLNREVRRYVRTASVACTAVGAANDVFSDYDLTGKKLYAHYVSAGGSGIDYAYDTAERLVTETSYGRALAFGLDQAGDRSTLTWPGTGGLVRYLYDADNRMTSLYETASGGTPVLTYGLIPGTLY